MVDFLLFYVIYCGFDTSLVSLQFDEQYFLASSMDRLVHSPEKLLPIFFIDSYNFSLFDYNAGV